MWRSDSLSVEPRYSSYLERLISLWKSSGRTAVRKELRDAPKVRARTSGPVRLRDGVDYSIRYARVGGKLSFQKTFPRLVHLTGYRVDLPWDMKIPLLQLCDHNYMELIYMSDEACRLWTIWAEENCVQFDGHYNYIFPGVKKRGMYRKAAFDAAKELGEVPSGFRSTEARIARAERRKAKKPVLRKGWTPLSIKEPILVRPSRSAASIRSAWWRLPPTERGSWTSYRSTVVVEPVLSLWCGKAKPVSELTCRLIAGLKRSVTVRKFEVYTDFDTKREHRAPIKVKPFPLDFRDPKSHPPMSMADCLRGRLDSIAESGFKETYTWFRLNHMLTKLTETPV